MNTKTYGIGLLVLIVGVAFAPTVAAEPTCPPAAGQTVSDTVQACLALAVATLVGAIGDAGDLLADLIATAQAAIDEAGDDIDALIAAGELLAQGIVALLAGLPAEVAALVVATLAFASGVIAFAGCIVVGPAPCVFPDPPA